MQAKPTFSHASSLDDEFVLKPRVDILSKATDDELKFTLSGVNVSIANGLRRIILSEIPIVVFRVSPNNVNKCTVHANTCGLNNEIVKQRLSCIPIHIKDVSDFPLKNYVMELNVQNNTDTTMYVTTQDFAIKDVHSGKMLPENKVREIFPADDITGDFIDFVRLKAKPAEEIHGKTIHLTCEFDIGTAMEDAAYNVVSTCSYGNTIDDVAQEVKLAQLKQKWKDEGKKESEVEFEALNWKLLEGKRVFKKDSFDFVIQSIGIHTNAELLVLACKVMIEKLQKLSALVDTNDVDIKLADSTIPNCYDIKLENEDYTLGKVIEYFLLTTLFEKKTATFCGFKMLHPHDTYSMLRVAYKDPVVMDIIKRDLKSCIDHSIDAYTKLSKEFYKLVSR